MDIGCAVHRRAQRIARASFAGVFLLLALMLGVSSVSCAQFGLSRLPGYKVLQTLDYVKRFYVDTVDNDELMDDAIRSLLEQLDPHSSYISKAEAEEVNSELEGHFYGIGIEFQVTRDTLRVVSAVPNAPAEKVGMRSGDRIVAVDGENIAAVGLTTQKVIKLLRGEKGSMVTVRAKRGEQYFDFKIRRGELPLHSVDVSYIVSPGIGYVRLNRFSKNTTSEMKEALAKLSAQGMQSLILDLRGNGGGIMQEAVSLASLFLPEKSSVVYARGRSLPKQELFAEQSEVAYQDMPLVVLVDEYTASASEILSGALQDWDRAVIVGRRSFGKGLVQNQVSLVDGSLIRVTVARYYTPSGRSIQTPYELGESKAYRQKFADRYRHGEVYSKDSIRVGDTLTYRTLRTGRAVHGGGGITPDVFVPIDTTGGSSFVGELLRKSIDSDWVTSYYDGHRKSLRASYPQYKDFAAGWRLDTTMVHDVLRAAAKREVKPKGDTLTHNDSLVLGWRIKALLARQLYGFSHMVESLNEHSDEVQKGVEILRSWESMGRPLLQPKGNGAPK
ncbi:MAG: peptidase S41 [Bacteroidia bacterium]|nr:MAG: peptidase S41 [Bacteroidia bacterium]